MARLPCASLLQILFPNQVLVCAIPGARATANMDVRLQSVANPVSLKPALP
jgi:hypothetical protein